MYAFEEGAGSKKIRAGSNFHLEKKFGTARKKFDPTRKKIRSCSKKKIDPARKIFKAARIFFQPEPQDESWRHALFFSLIITMCVVNCYSITIYKAPL